MGSGHGPTVRRLPALRNGRGSIGAIEGLAFPVPPLVVTGHCGRAEWGWPCWCEDSKSNLTAPVQVASPAAKATFGGAAAGWAMAMAAVGSYRVAAMGVRGWATGTQSRYHSAVSAVARFKGTRALQSPLIDTLSEFLASRVAMG